MGLKAVVVLSLLIAACIALPTAEGDLLGGILGPILSPILGILRIQGILFCTPNGAVGVNGSATPVFPNALVQLQCGGNVVSTTTTNGSGAFSILLDPINFVLSTVLSGCRLVVNTPLASCNAALPSVGGLVSNILSIGNSLVGGLNVGNLIPAGFVFNANVN